MMFIYFHSKGTTPSFNDKVNTLASGILVCLLGLTMWPFIRHNRQTDTLIYILYRKKELILLHKEIVSAHPSVNINILDTNY